MGKRCGSLLAIGVCMVLSACGGGSGGGGVGSTPPPPTAPAPAPTNGSIGELRFSQSFATEGASTTTRLNRDQGLVVNGSTARNAVLVRYDAATQSYTVEAPGRAQSFAPANLTTDDADEKIYNKSSGETRDTLTLVATPYTSNTPNRYVRIGFWQRNLSSPGLQDTTFDAFVYGLETPATALPRTGGASYATDVLGFVTTPGKEPRAFAGSGRLDVDLALGIFGAKSSVTEYSLTSPDSIIGGAIQFLAGGRLTTDNAFAGNFTYGGKDGQVSGIVNGRFFGPGGEELGAAFSADSAVGAAVSGSFTGQRDASAPSTNLSLINLPMEQVFVVSQAAVISSASTLPGVALTVGTSGGSGQFTRRPDGSTAINPHTSVLSFARFTSADRVTDSRANFETYESITNGRPARLSLYRSGSANTELALTYVSFGSWHASGSLSMPAEGRVFFAYGIDTARSLLERRTGTGRYDGVVYGAGARRDGVLYDVGGTSRFEVDFGDRRYNGSLVLRGQPTGGGAQTDLGTWTFANRLQSGVMIETQLSRAGLTDNVFNSITPRFFGPDGEEIGASFRINTDPTQGPGNIAIAGVTVAKRQ